MKKIFTKAIVSIVSILLFAGWGAVGHTIINKNITVCLPLSMHITASTWNSMLTAHASDADNRKGSDPNESPKHFIDIDAYPEFITNGTINQSYDANVNLHGSSYVVSQGTVPWAIQWTEDALRMSFQQKNWDQAMLLAADLGHYVGDGHQPLHVTQNYDGALTNQSGVHSRYETDLVGQFQNSILYTNDAASYVGNISNYVFNFIYSTNQSVAAVLYGDAQAQAITGNNSGPDYLQQYWNLCGALTIQLMKTSSKSVADLIYTAWVDAGSPQPDPSLSFTSPVGGESWQVLTSHNISWTYINVTNVKIEYSTNNGTNWSTLIASTPASTGSYSWTVPANLSTQCKVRISDVSNPSLISVSNIFSISSTLPPLLFSEDFTGLTTGNITVQSGGWTRFSGDVYLAISNTTPPLTYSGYNGGCGEYAVMPVGTSTSAKVVKTFTPTGPVASGNVYYFSFLLRLTQTFPMGSSTSNYCLTLGDASGSSGTYSPKLYARTSGSGFNIGISKMATSNTAITWGNSVLNLNHTYLILEKYVFNTLGAGHDDGIYLWVNPNISSEPLMGSAECQNDGGTNTSDLDLDNYQTPTGGIGSVIWNNKGVGNPVGAFDGIRLAYGTTSAGAWSSLNPVLSQISITSPIGGESWIIGTLQNITWTSSNVTNVKIEYSTNNGTDWLTEITSTPASLGSYSWRVPSIPSDQMLIKLTNVDNNALFDINTNTFRVNQYARINQTPAVGQNSLNFGATNVLLGMFVSSPAQISAVFYDNKDPQSGPLPSGINKASHYYWTISAPGIIFSNGYIKAPVSSLSGVNNSANLVWLKRTNPGDTWTNIGGTITGGYLVSTVAFSSFSEFAVGTSGNDLLPVELSTFMSIPSKRTIQLNWETKTEKNSDKFAIERKTVSSNWGTIGIVKAAVLSNSPKQYSFTDKGLQSGKYQYRLKMIDNDGTFEYSKVIENEVAIPGNFELSQNYPNPFNPSTRIDYNLPVDSKILLEVYDITGSLVFNLVNEEQTAGYYSVDFSSAKINKITSSGVYFYRITASGKVSGNNFSSIKKMILLK